MFKLRNMDTGEVFFVDAPRYVKLDERGVWVRCDEGDAQCIAVGGVRFSIFDKEPVDDAPQRLIVSAADIPAQLSSINRAGIKNAENFDEIQSAFLNLCDTVLDWYEELKRG